jgi:hypothetical protein
MAEDHGNEATPPKASERRRRKMKLLAMAACFAIATIGAVGLIAPSFLLDFGRTLQGPSVLYLVAAIRVIFGVALLWVAPASRMPQTVRVIGILIIVVGVLGPFHSGEGSSAMLDLWEAQGPLFMRVWAGVTVAFGLFIAYAVSAPRRPAKR